jgi:hypothetical protein
MFCIANTASYVCALSTQKVLAKSVDCFRLFDDKKAVRQTIWIVESVGLQAANLSASVRHDSFY